MPFEDEFSHALRETAEASPPARLGLIATGAAERGRRRKRRRALTASVATVAAVACAGMLAFQLRPANGPTGPLDPGRSAGPASAAPASASASASTGPSPSAATGPAQLLEVLRAKLPAGLQASRPMSSGRGTSGPGAGLLEVGYTITNGTGTGSVQVTVNRVAPGALQDADGACEPGLAGCTSVRQSDGGRLRIYRPARAAGGEQTADATLRRPDGTVVSVSAGNLPGPGSGRTEPYPNAPLLTAEQLGALALDPVWQPFAASLPVR
ncbi:hypothetical protein [Kitasatospora paranensis]|uniref:Uncharacterized protein n=1 Tax=Kitasatospora paranensis TaxID=258053 RepID=A0ABW2FVD1_9ACTN